MKQTKESKEMDYQKTKDHLLACITVLSEFHAKFKDKSISDIYREDYETLKFVTECADTAAGQTF